MEKGIGFDLKALEVFFAVVDYGGMTAAGQHLGITQSAVSQTLAALEANLHAQLLDRSLRPPQLTPAGRHFYERARPLLAEARRLSLDFRKQERSPLQHVRIGLVDSLVTSIGPDLIELVRRRTPHWSVITGQSHRHAELLLSRELDLILSDDPVAAHPELQRLPLIQEPFVLLLPRYYQGPISLKALAATGDFIRYNPTTLIGQRIEQLLRRAHVEPPLRLTLDNSYAVASLVRAGVGWTISTPLCLLQCGLFDEQVQCLPLPGEPQSRTLSLVVRPGELGNLPEQLAEDSISLLRDGYLPGIAERMPWLLPSIQLNGQIPQPSLA
ncbi:MAG: LysR family transcriptional regulator [Gammaproteobacteria bacterium]|nr:LysR family transcriptional regulator [Gammaproteobacteria bacterium]